MSPFLLVDEIIAAQTPKVEAPFIELLRSIEQIVEIGFHRGGFSLWLYKHKRDDCPLVSYDITRDHLQVSASYNIDFRIGDCFSESISNEIITMIRQPKRTLLLCDGGDKEREFNFFCQFMKPNDIIMLHDYADNDEDYTRIQGQLNWPTPAEAHFENIKRSMESRGLKKYHYNEFKEVLWGCFAVDDSLPKVKIVCMMRIKNEERWLRETLNSASRLVDGFVILDDGSTDKTPEICRQHPKVLRFETQNEPTIDEVRDKNALLRMALDESPDWILALDGDEILEDVAPLIIRREIAACSPEVGVFGFNFLYMWDSHDRFRADGIYKDLRHPRMFKITDAGVDPQSLTFHSTTHGGNFHCGSVPPNLSAAVRFIDVNVKHYGYFDKSQREQKRRFYEHQDPENAARGYYNHLTSEEGIVLLPWRERSEQDVLVSNGIPNRAAGLHVTDPVIITNSDQSPIFDFETMFDDSAYPWAGHKWFGYDLVKTTKPKLLVELGTYKGTSLFSFCQAVKDAGLDTRICAIDTWQGDKHNGFYGGAILEEVKRIKRAHYATVDCTLIQKTFDEALPEFADRSIDILHIDGLHTYEAVKHDYETWRGKVKEDGIILFHDIVVKEQDFGVFKLWEELRQNGATIQFLHSNGLGVLFNDPTHTLRSNDPVALQVKHLRFYESKLLASLNRLAKHADPPGKLIADAENSLAVQKAKLHFQMYELLRAKGDGREAERELEIAAQYDPSLAEIHNAFGVQAYEKQNIPLAQKNFERAVRLNSAFTDARKNLADIYAQQGNADNAIKQLNKVLEVSPNDVDALSSLGSISINMQALEDAFFYFSRALKVSPADQTVMEIVDQLQSKGCGTPETLAALAQMSAFSNSHTDPSNAKAARSTPTVGTFLRKDEPADDAIVRLMDLVQRHPENTVVHNDLGVLYYNRGDVARARSHFQRAVDCDDNHLAAKKNLGDVLVQIGDGKAALRVFQGILGQFPDDVDALISAGGLLRIAQRYMSAAYHLKRALELDPMNESAQTIFDLLQQEAPEVDQTPSPYPITKKMAASSIGAGPELFMTKPDLGRPNLLINPNSMVQSGYTPPPLGLLFLAAMDENTQIIDMALSPNVDIAEYLMKAKPKVVGVPVYTVGRKESFRLLKRAKEAGAITVAGGPHIPLMFTMSWKPEKEYPYIDHFVFGDGELAWQSITAQSDTRNGVVWKQEKKNPPDLNALPLPAYGKIQSQDYPARPATKTTWRGIDLTVVPRYSVVFGRGCTGSCNFCSTWWVHGKYRHHSIEWMEKHLDQLWNMGARHLCFQDDCLTVDRGAFLDLCGVLKKYNFACFGTTRADYTDQEMMYAAYDAGFYEFAFGIEHGSQHMLDEMHKKTNLDAAFKAREFCKKAGISFTALMMEGYPGETEDDRQENSRFLAKLDPDETGTIGHIMVLPGTKLYRQCRDAGLINDNFWLGNEPYYAYRGGPLGKGDSEIPAEQETGTREPDAQRKPVEWTTEQEPVVSVVIPVFNNFAYTKKCLESIFSTKQATAFEVIVVDDASTDGSSDLIRQLPFPTRIVRHEENKGFAISCNDGATVSTGKYLLFLNNDTVVLPGWMDALRTCLLNDAGIGLVGNLQIFPDTGKVQQAGIVCGENKMVYSIYNNQLPHDHPAVNKPREFQFIAGSCMMLEKDFFFSVGGFDQSYVNSCEDVDLCMKVRQAGKKVFYCPESRILHFESKTVSGHDKSGKNYRLFLERWSNKMFKDDHLYLKADGVASIQKSTASFSVLKNRNAIEIARDELQCRGSNVLAPNIQREFTAHGYVPRVGDKLKSWDVLKTINFLEQHIERNSPVLDIGTFCSEIPCSLHRMKFENLSGIDLNPEVKRMPYCERINYTVGDFFHTPFPDASFSAITAISVIEHGFKSELLLKELSRLLSPGGFFIASIDYWKEKISTDGLTWFEMDWRIFSKEEMLDFFDEAAKYGLYPIGSMDFETGEKAISWNDREYTFAWFVLQKEGEPMREAVHSRQPSSKATREKIAFLSTYNQICGISSHTEAIVKALQDATRQSHSFDPEIFVLSESGVPTRGPDGPYVIRCWRRNDENFDHALDAIVKCGISNLHIQFQDGIFEHTELLGFVRKCRSLNVKVFISFHSVERVLSHCANLVNESTLSFVHLEQNKVRLAGEGADISRIRILPLGVRDRRAMNISSEEAKRALNLPNDIKVISSFGFLEPHKGITEIIRSLPTIARKHNAIFFHVGGGHPGNPKSLEYSRLCKEEATRLGVAERVHLLDGYIPDEVVSKYLFASDAIVMNYQINRNEGSAAVASALSHRRPIITTAMPPFKTLADCTLQLSDSLPLDEAICSIFEKPDLRRYLARQVDDFIAKNSYEEVASTLLDCYSSSAARKRTDPPCVGIDARTFYYSDSVVRGIGHYSLYHLLRTVQLRRDWKFVLFGESGEVPKSLDPLLALPNVEFKSVDEYKNLEVDLVHVCDSMNILGGFDSPYRLFKAANTTVTFYDLTPKLLYVQSWPEAQRRSYDQRLEQLKCSNAAILAISKFTKDDLVSKAAIPAERIEVIMAGLNAAASAEITVQRVEEVKARFGITKPFFLHVGALDPHKKFDTTLKAFVECSRQTKCQLVVVGQMEYYIKAYADYVKQNKIKNVVFTGFIAREDLEVLYSEARALVFMSMYEGFGFPVLEAMAKGCPVITSNATSIPEVAGDAALMFGSDDVPAVAKAMLDLMKNESLRRGLREKGLLRAKMFTWDECARKTVAIWERMLGINTTVPLKADQQQAIPVAVKETPTIALPAGTKPQVLYHSALFDPSGYADEGRHFIGGLQQHGFDIVAREIGRHSEQFKKQLEAGTRETLDRLLAKQPMNGCISVIHFPAYAFQRVPGAAYNIGRSMFETDSLPTDWVVRCNMMDEVWVPSDFNVETFRSAGVTTKLVKIPGGIDIDQFKPCVAPMRLKGVRGKVFLSVFEWSYRKGWDVLLDGWVNAFNRTDDVCLVLRTYPVNATDNKNVKQEIESRIDSYLKSKHGVNRSHVAPIIVLGNQISEADMPSLFAAADVYLAPSRGEGWGRPQMSAMAMGLPVIATRWSGNLEFMNDANSFLIDVDGVTTIDDRMENSLYRGQQWAQPSVENFASLLRRVVEHPDEAKAIGEHARADMENKWSWKVVAQKISERVDQISSQLHKATTGPKPAPLPSVVWEGPQFANSSLALVNRELCKGLVANGHEFSSLHVGRKEFAPEAGTVAVKIQAAENVTIKNPDIHVRHHWPPNLNPPESGRWVVIQPWEFGSLPKDWVDVFTTQVDECWVYSRYVEQVYVSSGVPASKVVVVPLGIDAQKFYPDVKPFSLKTKKKFRFLFVGGTIFRKGIDILIEAYTNAFTKSDDVCLVIKDFGGETFYKGQTIKGTISQIRSRKDAPEIEYIDRVLTEDEIAGLYAACNVLVHPYRGEGFGLPILEAMACGTPAIVTDGGAARDFCNATNSLLVKAEMKRLTEKKVGDLETVDYPWMFEVDRAALASAMRYAVDNPEAIAALGTRAQSDVHANWTWEKSFETMKRRMDVLKTKPIFRFSAALALQQVSEMLVGAGCLYHEKKYHETLHVLRLVEKTLDQQVPAEERVPLTANLESFRGDCYLQMEMLDEAKESYERALRGNPESSQACAGIGQILYLKGFDEQAKAMFEWAVKNDPSNQMAVRGLVTVNEVLGLPPTHSALSEAASNEENAHFERLLGTAAESFQQNDFASALELAKEIAEKVASYESLNKSDVLAAALNLQGECHLALGDVDAARTAFEEALHVNPNSSHACAGMAEILLHAGQIEHAKTMYEWAVRNEGDNETAIAGLANVNKSLGLPDDDNSLESETVAVVDNSSAA